MKRRRVGLILTALLVALCVLVSGCGKNLQAASGNSEGTESSGGISAASTENGQSGEVWESRESSGGSSGAEEPSVSPSETGATAPNTGTATTAADRGSAATAAPTPVVTRPPAAVTTSTTVSVSILTRPKTTVGTPATTATLPPKEEAVQKNLTPLSPNQYYGYLQLAADGDKNMIELYRRLVSAVEAVKTSIDISDLKLTKDQCGRVFYYYIDDYPQHFWRKNQYGLGQYGGETTMATLSLDYYFSGDRTEINRKKQLVEAEIAEILTGITDSQPAFERERIIHDRLVQRVTYDLNAGEHVWDIYGTLMDGRAVCEGYTRTFQRLMYLAGIPCLVVRGTGGGEDHAWNMVKLEGDWYHIDVTWDDAPNFSDGRHYLYFNLTTAAISADHAVRRDTASGSSYPLSYPVPAASATAQNYFVKNGLVWSRFQTDQVAAGIRYAKNSGLTQLHFRSTGDTNAFIKAYQKNLSALKSQSGVSISQTGVSYSYIPGTDVVMISIQ